MSKSDNQRPLVTFAVIAYNQEKYIREAVEGALAQSYSPLEIILSDDCSSDKTFQIMQSMAAEYDGPHIIRINRNQSNLGLIAHVNKMFEFATGDWIVASAGDDISLPIRTQRIVEMFQASEGAMLIHSNVIKIDERGNDIDEWIPPIVSKKMSIEDIAKPNNLYIGASGAWSKDLYHRFGPIKYSLVYEDLIFGFRAALNDSICYINEPLVRYRVNVGISAKTIYSHSEIKERIRDRKNRNLRSIDVYQQRIADTITFGVANKRILRVLNNELKVDLIRNFLYYGDLHGLFSLLKAESMRLVMRFIYEESRFCFSIIKYKVMMLMGYR